MGNGVRRDEDAATMAAGDRIALALAAAEATRYSDMSESQFLACSAVTPVNELAICFAFL